MYIIGKKDFDDIGEAVLAEYMPEVLSHPCAVDIEELAQEHLYLELRNAFITIDGSVLGMIAFDDATFEGYDSMYRPEEMSLPAGTVVIDLSLCGQTLYARRRFTIAHECSHWICHRSYHAPDNRTYNFRSNASQGILACRSENIEKGSAADRGRKRTDDDWEEWQADSLAAAILMPRRTFLDSFRYAMGKEGMRQPYIVKGEDRYGENAVIRALMDTFKVSYKATEIRLKTLGLLREYQYYGGWESSYATGRY